MKTLLATALTVFGLAGPEAAQIRGDFAFSDVPEGDYYDMSAELSGFERARRAVRVLAAERVSLSLALRVSILEETIVTRVGSLWPWQDSSRTASGCRPHRTAC
jgi:hypothetical protein